MVIIYCIFYWLFYLYTSAKHRCQSDCSWHWSHSVCTDTTLQHCLGCFELESTLRPSRLPDNQNTHFQLSLGAVFSYDLFQTHHRFLFWSTIFWIPQVSRVSVLPWQVTEAGCLQFDDLAVTHCHRCSRSSMSAQFSPRFVDSFTFIQWSTSIVLAVPHPRLSHKTFAPSTPSYACSDIRTSRVWISVHEVKHLR